MLAKQLFDEMSQFNPCEELKKYQGPLFMVHGDKDSKVAYQDAVDCFNSLPNKQKKLQTLKGSEHGFHDEPFESQVVEIIINFFNEHIK